MNQKEYIRTNILTIGLNKLLENNLITLNENDKRMGCYVFDYDATKYLIRFRDIGHGELEIIMYWDLKINIDLNGDELNITKDLISKKTSYDIYVMGWVERKIGKYIQTSKCDRHSFNIKCSPKKITYDKLKNMTCVNTNGFEKKGQLIL